VPLGGFRDDEHWGSGRELFAGMRNSVNSAEEGAMTFDLHENEKSKP